jgi:acyl-coenzyme A thioesterase PaaI-like protein
MDREDFKSRLQRYGINLFPAFRASGDWLTHISADFRHVRLKLPLNSKTRNYVGTLCGGNMYSAIDGVYMVMLIKILGKGYVVWDKSATIRYRKPAKGALFAEFRISDSEIDAIRHGVESEGKTDREFLVELKDVSNTVCAEVVKTIHIRKKAAVL